MAVPVALEQGLKPVSSNLRRPPSPGLPNGKFLPWIADEFEMSRQTADNFTSVYERFGNGKLPNFSNFKPSILYALSAPSTPDSVVEKAIEKAEAGECRNYPPVDFKSPHQKQETPTGAWLIGVFIWVWRNILRVTLSRQVALIWEPRKIIVLIFRGWTRL